MNWKSALEKAKIGLAAALNPTCVSIRILCQAWDTREAGPWRIIRATPAMEKLIPELFFLLMCRRSL
jgi:hypothetical protein